MSDRQTVEIEVEKCRTCGRKMVDVTSKRAKEYYGLFPSYYEDTLQAQLKRANIVFRGSLKDKTDNYLCEICEKEDKSTFVCALCGVERASSLKKESLGDPPEHLCQVCYETKSAKVWEEKYHDLYERHKYDFE